MVSQRKTSVLLITIMFLQFLYQTKSSPSSIPPFVKERCDKTKNPTFCIKTLASDSRTPKAKNDTEVTEIFLSIGIKDADKSRDYVDGLSKRAGLKPRDKEALVACSKGFDGVSYNFKSALTEVEEGEFEAANYDVMISFDSVRYCQDSLADAKLHIPEIDLRLNVTATFIWIADEFTSTF